MEIYKFELTPANRKSHIDFKDIEEQHQLFSLAINNCNSGVSYKRDGKKLTLDKITSNYIHISLSSSTVLTAPKRTLSAFSRELIRLDKTNKCLTCSIYNHTLFNTKSIEVPMTSKMTIDQISDSFLLKSIIDLLYAPTTISEEERNKTIIQIKEIMLPFISKQ